MSPKIKTFAFVILLLSGGVCVAQPVGNANSAGLPQRPVVGGTTSLVLLNDIETLSTSPVLFGGNPLSTTQPVTLIGIPEIANEISLDDEQRELIDKISKDTTRNIEKFLFSAAPESDQADLGLEIQDNIKRLRNERDVLIATVLRNEQKKRLRQILIQMQIQSLGEVDGLTSSPIASQIGLEAQESERLRKYGKKIEAEMNKKIEKIRADAREKIRNELGQEQQARLIELLGERIDFGQINKNNNSDN